MAETEVMYNRDNVPSVPLPENHKAKVLIWSDLTVSHLSEMGLAQSADDMKRLLSEIFTLDESKRCMVLLDFYYYNIQFCKEQKFTAEQTSALFSVMKSVHEVCVETPFNNLDAVFKYFKELILSHSVKRPPFSIDVFTADNVKAISHYALTTYFRHYKLYKYVFTPKVRLDLSMMYKGLPATPVPSEAGDQPQTGDDNIPEEDETEGGEAGDPGRIQSAGQTSISADEAEDVKELRTIINQHLSAEIKNLRISIDDQLKNQDELLNLRLGTLADTKPPAKSRPGSKSKKK